MDDRTLVRVELPAYLWQIMLDRIEGDEHEDEDKIAAAIHEALRHEEAEAEEVARAIQRSNEFAAAHKAYQEHKNMLLRGSPVIDGFRGLVSPPGESFASTSVELYKEELYKVMIEGMVRPAYYVYLSASNPRYHRVEQVIRNPRRAGFARRSLSTWPGNPAARARYEKLVTIAEELVKRSAPVPTFEEFKRENATKST